MNQVLREHQFENSTIATDRERVTTTIARMVAAVHPETDAPLCLGRRLDAARNRYNQLDEMGLELQKDEHVARSIFDEAGLHEYDRELALRQLISFERAETLDSAAVQIGESIIALDLLWDQFPDEQQNFHVKQDHRRLRRLLFSVLEFLRSHSVEKLYTYGEGLVGNPWISAEELVERHWRICGANEIARQARLARRKEQQKA